MDFLAIDERCWLFGANSNAMLCERLMNFDGLRVTFMPVTDVSIMFICLRLQSTVSTVYCLHQFVVEFFELAPSTICRFIIHIHFDRKYVNLVDPVLSDVINSSDSNYFRLFRYVQFDLQLTLSLEQMNGSNLYSSIIFKNIKSTTLYRFALYVKTEAKLFIVFHLVFRLNQSCAQLMSL